MTNINLCPLKWRSVVGFERYYAVSDHGHVRRKLPGRGTQQDRILKGTLGKGWESYLTVTLFKKGEKHTKRIHSLVLESFRGPRPFGTVGHHINGNPLDNRLSNLEYESRSANSQCTYAKAEATYYNKKEVNRETSKCH